MGRLTLDGKRDSMPLVDARHSLYILALHGVTVMGALIGATVLGFHGTLDAAAVTAIYGAALGFAGGTASSLGSLGAVVNGKTLTSPAVSIERENTLRYAMSAGSGPAYEPPVAPQPTNPGENG